MRIWDISTRTGPRAPKAKIMTKFRVTYLIRNVRQKLHSHPMYPRNFYKFWKSGLEILCDGSDIRQASKAKRRKKLNELTNVRLIENSIYPCSLYPNSTLPLSHNWRRKNIEMCWSFYRMYVVSTVGHLLLSVDSYICIIVTYKSTLNFRLLG